MLKKLLDRPISVTMVLLVLIVMGFVAIDKLPVSLIPDVDIPYITVQVTAPDMSARELDNAVVKPLRQSLVQISHLKEIKAETKDGTSTISLTFEEGKDIDYFFIEVNEKIDRAMSSLPRISRPKVFKASATDIPAFYINMTLVQTGASPEDDFRQMSDFASDVISKRIEQLPEVAMVDISGTVSSEILIIPDEERLRQLGMGIAEFESKISSANVSLSNLTIRDGEYHYNVKFQSFASSAEDIANVYFKVEDRVLQIKDVAEVTTKASPRSGLALSDGDEAVILAVIKQSEAKMSDLKKSISSQLERFEQDYPQIKFTVTRDQTALLEYSINNLLLNIILAILLDCLIIFLFMKDLRSPLLVALTIPVSLIISVFIFYIIGLTINIISLSGLLLGVGMMVDNTIILTDNITARWQKGEALMDAIIEGTKEVSGAMLSSVLTTCAVFIPLIFMGGIAGELFYDQAIAVTVVLMTSYLVTVILIPVYYWVAYKKLPEFKPNKFLARLEFKKGIQLYDKTEGWFLRNLWTVYVFPLVCAAIIAACVIWMPKEKLPPITYTDAIVGIDWNENITIDENRARIQTLEAEVQALCLQQTSMVGVQQFVLSHSGDQSMSQASIYVNCKDAETLERVTSIIQAEARHRYASALTSLSTSGNIFDMVFSEKEPQLLARLRPVSGDGLKPETLKTTLEAIRTAIPDVQVDEIPLKTDVLYVADAELMSLYDVSFSDLTRILSNALNGNTVFEIVQGDRSLPVILGTDVQEMDEILSASFIKTEETEIPVSAVMRQTWEQDFKSLVSGDDGDYYPLALDVPASQVKATMAAVTDAVHSEGDYDTGYSGSYFSNRQMMRQMALVLLLAIALLFLILASQFESLIQPAIILSEVIIDIAVSLAALCAFGVSINLMSLIGLIVICGIVINDSILKIDTINRLVRSGHEIAYAIHEAGHRRIKAIIMTSLTTILAVLPFLSRGNMGDDLQYPMALVIVVGMTVGTLVSLFFVPAVYAAIYRKK